jgi:hypothetical protein
MYGRNLEGRIFDNILYEVVSCVISRYLLVSFSTSLCELIQANFIFEDFSAVTVRNVVFLDVTPCGYCKNRLYGEMYYLGTRISELETTSVLTRVTLRHIPECVILHGKLIDSFYSSDNISFFEIEVTGLWITGTNVSPSA